jgi:hypothetical protein
MLKQTVLLLVVLGVLFNGVSQAAVTTYATRLAFDLANPGLPVEGFEAAAEALSQMSEGQNPHLYPMEDGEVLDVDTGNDVFDSEDILPGIQISAYYEEGNLYVLGAGSDWYGFPIDDVKISNMDDCNRFNMVFPDGVNAVAFDIMHGGETVGIKAFDADDEIIGYEFDIEGDFFGIQSTEPIFRIEVNAPPRGCGHIEVIDNIAFGNSYLIPEEKIAELLHYFEKAVRNKEIRARARGWRGNLRVLSVYWNLTFAEFLIDRDRDRLARQNLMIALKSVQSWFTGKAVDRIVVRIEDLIDSLATHGATYTYDPNGYIILMYPPNAYFGNTFTIDKNTEFLPEFETSEGTVFNFSVVHGGNGGDPANYGFEFYEDGKFLTSTHHLSPSSLSGPDVTDTFGPFNLSNDNWKLVIKNVNSNGGGIFVDKVLLTALE